MDMRKDHESRPLFICENNTIFLETFNKLYRTAYEFLIAIVNLLRLINRQIQ